MAATKPRLETFEKKSPIRAALEEMELSIIEAIARIENDTTEQATVSLSVKLYYDAKLGVIAEYGSKSGRGRKREAVVDSQFTLGI